MTVALYAADAWKPALMPGVQFYFCVIDLGPLGQLGFLFRSRYERDERIRRRSKQGYRCVHRGRVTFKEQN